AVRLGIVERDGGDYPRLTRLGDIDNRSAELILVRNVADIGVAARNRDLPRAGKIEMAEATDIAGKRGCLSFHCHRVSQASSEQKRVLTLFRYSLFAPSSIQPGAGGFHDRGPFRNF